ncbi:hypothetical protein LTR37_020866 [Vermiconidia calcicola]|uniref:Uncharacterized protein n=1 Tax=Vermiconidia calcicola TaxID=1690605 RepID=A0ACC3MA03_9PEZI|nr:hypothetical protein LTR37_020866 [Vermiconidia calcicola]
MAVKRGGVQRGNSSWNPLAQQAGRGKQVGNYIYLYLYLYVSSNSFLLAKKTGYLKSSTWLNQSYSSTIIQRLLRMALREKGIPFDMAIPDGLGSGRKISGLEEANPRMEVPALVDGDFQIFDSKIILQYLEDQYPEYPLLPKDPKSRAEARMIEEVCDTGYEAINWGLGEITWSERATGELADNLLTQANTQTKILLDWLTERLGDKQFFNGDSFGYADICVAPYVNRSCVYGNGPADGTPLRAWRERVLEIPSVKQTTGEMQAATQKMASTFKDLFKAGTGRRREYRDHRLEWMIKSGGFEVVERGLKEDTIRFSWPGGI